MSEITKQDVEYVSNLARISLTENEKEKMIVNLKDIVKYVGKLSELDNELEDVEPTFHAWEGKGTLLREDEVGESVNRDEIMEQAPKTQDGFFVVPKVIDTRV